MPADRPVLIAANHPMAFCEACLLACFLDRPLHFLVRGDVFVSRWKWFFDWTNQIPIYRFRDGFSNMRKNTSSFELAHQALADRKVILIFSEGNTKLQKKLSPLQKGTARLAFGAYEAKGVEDLVIVPVGINYTDGTSFRSSVLINVGEGIPLKPFLPTYQKDAHAAVREVTDHLYQRLLPLIVHIEQEERIPLSNEVLDYLEQVHLDAAWPVVDTDDARFVREKAMVDRMNGMTDDDYTKLVHAWKVAPRVHRSSTNADQVVKWLLLVIGLPILVSGFVLNALPFYTAKWIAQKRVKQIEFYTPVRMGLMIILILAYYTLFTLLAVVAMGAIGVLALPLLAISGYGVILWHDLWRAIRAKVVQPSPEALQLLQVA